VIIERTENPQWLSNAYLIADPKSSMGVLIDGNDVLEPLLECAQREGIEITHILLTHSHPDHVAGLTKARERLGNPAILGHQAAAAEFDSELDRTLNDGDCLNSGGLKIEAIFTPGHAAGHLSYLINDSDVFTADVLFKGTVGGTMAPGGSGFDDLKSSVMDRLMTLAPEISVHPGHSGPTTINAEWENNPFVRIWRGLDQPDAERCLVWGRGASLKLWAPDYDGGHKAWIRFDDSGEEAIIGGSQVQRS
jgi:hydroxyacylglutathione hydrolase